MKHWPNQDVQVMYTLENMFTHCRINCLLVRDFKPKCNSLCDIGVGPT